MEASIGMPSVFRELSESLSMVQKNIILREITTLIDKLKHIENEADLRAKNERYTGIINNQNEKERNMQREIQRLSSSIENVRNDYEKQVSENARLLKFFELQPPVIGNKRIRTTPPDPV